MSLPWIHGIQGKASALIELNFLQYGCCIAQSGVTPPLVSLWFCRGPVSHIFDLTKEYHILTGFCFKWNMSSPMRQDGTSATSFDLNTLVPGATGTFRSVSPTLHVHIA